MSAVDTLIDKLIVREGGYVNNPNDRGGPTNFGITQSTLASFRMHSVSADDVQNMSVDEAKKIYKSNYFRGIDAVTDPRSLEFLFDYSVNSGVTAAVKALQTAIGTTADGAFGPKSKAALDAFGDQSQLYWVLVCYRFDNFMRIMGNDPSQTVFAHGWANRMKEFWVPKHV